MKTVLIFDQCGNEPIQFTVLDGDFKHLQGVYINDACNDEARQQELSDLLYNTQGEYRLHFEDTFPTDAVRNGAEVIVAGFLP